MGRYISLPVETDPDVLVQDAYAKLQELVPGWEPNEGNLDTWLLQTGAWLASALGDIAKDVPEEIFRYFGEEILQVQPKVASYATFLATWTALDTNGYIIPAGTIVGVRAPTGDLMPFAVAAQATITAGATTATGVVMTATNPGADSSGLVTTGSAVTLIDALPWVSSVVGTTPTAGGADGETTDEYMDRLVDEFQLLSPRPILAQDYGPIVRHIEGIDRAYVLNLYKADTNTSGVEKAVTVAVTDENGNAVSSTLKGQAYDLLTSMREINMLIYVVDPQYQNIAIVYNVNSVPNVDIAALKTDIDAALTDAISPKNWGKVEVGTDILPYWRPDPKVRYLDVAQIILNVNGTDYINSLTLNGSAADVTLNPGSSVPIVLPRATPITGTVVLGT